MMTPAFPACNKRRTSYFYPVATTSSAVTAQHPFIIAQRVVHPSSRRSKSTSDILILDYLPIKFIQQSTLFPYTYGTIKDGIILIVYICLGMR